MSPLHPVFRQSCPGRRFLPLVTALLALTVLVCSDNQNPFEQSSNARSVVLDNGALTDGAGVTMYTTYQLAVGVLVPELVDSVTVHADANRYFADTTIASPTTEDYVFPVSLVDTGWQEVQIVTHRSDGDQTAEEVTVFVTSPLDQADVEHALGQETVFQTTPVGDTVFYHWEFGDDAAYARTVVTSSYHVVTRTLSYVDLLPGRLWVSVDSAGQVFPSPSVPFHIRLTDEAPPGIEGLTGGDADTLLTGDTLAVLLLRITDNGDVDRVDVDGRRLSPFSADVYRATVEDLLSQLDSTATVEVRAYDMAGNEAVRSFTVRYDPAAPSLQDTRVFITNVSGTAETNRLTYRLYGRISEYVRASVVVTASVNGAPVSDTTVVAINDDEGTFALTAPLDADSNGVTVSVLDNSGTELAGTYVLIVYDASYQDVDAPTIQQIRVDGRAVQPGYPAGVGDTTAVLDIVAFDGAGIASLTVNGVPAALLPGSEFEWRQTVSGIAYGDSLRVVIRAADSVGNASEATVLLQYNRVPGLSEGHRWPSPLLVDVPMSVDFTVVDESPAVAVSLTDAPSGMTLTGLPSTNGFRISWTPDSSDLGLHGVGVVLDDGVQDTTVLWLFSVVEDTSSAVRFAGDSSDTWPAVLQAETDTLTANLTVVPTTGSPPYTYTMLVDGIVVATDTRADPAAVLTWAPGEDDVGSAVVLVVVDDGILADTIRHPVTVVPANSHPCVIDVTVLDSVGSASGGELDMRTASGPVRVEFAILDSDHPFTEHYTRSVTRAGVTDLTELDSARSLTIVLDTTADRYRDTIRVVVSDATGTSDTAIVHVLYPSPMPRPSDSWEWPARFIGGESYSLPFELIELGRDVSLTFQNAPSGMNAISTGENAWTIGFSPGAADSGSFLVSVVLNDGGQDTTISWAFDVLADASRLVDLVLTAPLPTFVEAGQIAAASLAVAANTGKAPFTYEVRVTETGALLLNQGASDRLPVDLSWPTTAADIGEHILRMTVTDSYGDSDTLYRSLQVVPANVSPCSLSVAPGPGTVLTGDGDVDMSGATGPASLLITIHDSDHPLTEEYTVTVKQGHITSVETLDSAGTVTVHIDTASGLSRDTLLVTVSDATGTSDSVEIFVYYRPIKLVRINTAGGVGGADISEELHDFPVLVRLDAGNFNFGGLPASNPPLTFESMSGTELPYELEVWDPAGLNALIWVLADTVHPQDSSQYIRLLVEPGLTSSPNAVFDTAAGYLGVWHLDEDVGPVADATAAGNTGTPSGAASATGLMEDARRFYADGSKINMGGDTLLHDAATWSAWANYSSLGFAVGDNVIMACGAYGGSSDVNYQYTLSIRNDRHVRAFWEYNAGADDSVATSVPVTVSSGTWHHYAAVRDKDTRTLLFYVDGVQVGTPRSYTYNPTDGVNGTFQLGAYQSDEANLNFNGYIDEVRLADVQRSPGWMKLTYETQKPGSQVVTVE